MLKVDRIWPKVSHGTKSVRLVIETITKGGAMTALSLLFVPILYQKNQIINKTIHRLK